MTANSTIMFPGAEYRARKGFTGAPHRTCAPEEGRTDLRDLFLDELAAARTRTRGQLRILQTIFGSDHGS